MVDSYKTYNNLNSNTREIWGVGCGWKDSFPTHHPTLELKMTPHAARQMTLISPLPLSIWQRCSSCWWRIVVFRIVDTPLAQSTPYYPCPLCPTIMVMCKALVKKSHIIKNKVKGNCPPSFHFLSLLYSQLSNDHVFIITIHGIIFYHYCYYFSTLGELLATKKRLQTLWNYTSPPTQGLGMEKAVGVCISVVSLSHYADYVVLTHPFAWVERTMILVGWWETLRSRTTILYDTWMTIGTHVVSWYIVSCLMFSSASNVNSTPQRMKWASIVRL